MEALLEALSSSLRFVVEISVRILEAFAIIIILKTTIQAFWHWLKQDKFNISMSLSKGVELSLGFLMAGEVLETIVANEAKDLLVLAAMVGVRAAMNLESHLEIKSGISLINAGKNVVKPAGNDQK